MIRWIGMCMVCLATSCYGYILGQRWAQRLSQLMDFRVAFLELSGQIRYGQTSLAEAFQIIGNHFADPVGGFFLSVGHQLEHSRECTFREIYEGQLSSWFGKGVLTTDDLDRLKQTGSLLGTLDLDTQVQVLTMHIEQLERICQDLKTTVANRQKVCRTLGLASGVLLVILLL